MSRVSKADGKWGGGFRIPARFGLHQDTHYSPFMETVVIGAGLAGLAAAALVEPAVRSA